VETVYALIDAGACYRRQDYEGIILTNYMGEDMNERLEAVVEDYHYDRYYWEAAEDVAAHDAAEEGDEAQ
jgi:hypothetical protein